MTKFIFELYAAISAFATFAYVGFGWASSKRPISDELERIRDFDQFMGCRRSDFRPETGTASRGKRALAASGGPNGRLMGIRGQRNAQGNYLSQRDKPPQEFPST